MYYPSNLRCRLRSPMRHAGTYELHHVTPCVGYVPVGIHANTVKSLPRRLVPGPYEGPVVLPDLQLKECLVVAAYRYSLGYTCGVLLWGSMYRFVISLRVGGYGAGLRLLSSGYLFLASDSLCCSVSLPRLGLTMSLWLYIPRGFGSVFPGLLLPVYANVPFPWRRYP